jgi:aminoglycoside 6'-N-acetyltransferase
MTEGDWEILFPWNNDPAILHFAEGDRVTSRTMAEVKDIYRSVSRTAFCFIIEWGGQPVGECWLQEMNLDRILDQFSEQDCRRIDLMIGEKAYWNRGIGTRIIRMLTQLAFERESAYAVFGCDIWGFNARSLRAFEKAGFRESARVRQRKGSKGTMTVDMVIQSDAFSSGPARQIS